jgi:HlyD family secretion protein
VEVDALPDVELKGEVTEIANSATIAGSGTADQKTEFRVKIAITDPDSQLRPGMTATADIVTDRRESAVGVPIQAVAVRTAEQLRGDAEDEEVSKWKVDDDGFVEIVFVVDDGKAEAQQVETGIQSETHIEIIEGLSEGDQVVVGNYRAISRDLQDGSEVEMAGASEDDDSGPS